MEDGSLLRGSNVIYSLSQCYNRIGMPAPVVRSAIVPVTVSKTNDADTDDGAGEESSILLGLVSVQATFFGTGCVWLFVTDCPEDGLPALGAATIGIPGPSGSGVLKSPLLELQHNMAPANAVSLVATGNIDQVSTTVSPQSTFSASLAHRLVKRFASTGSTPLVVYAFCGVSNANLVGTSQSGMSPGAAAFSSTVMGTCTKLIEDFRVACAA